MYMCDLMMLLSGLLNFDRSQLSHRMAKMADFGIFEKPLRRSLKPASPIKIYQVSHMYMCDLMMLLSGLLNFDRSQLSHLMAKMADFGIFEKPLRRSLKLASPYQNISSESYVYV